jgi:predicted branched-subunit amino acid permease
VPPTPQGVWTALIVLTAVIIGVGAGMLAWAGGANPPNAILVAGASFGGTALLILAVFNFRVSTGWITVTVLVEARSWPLVPSSGPTKRLRFPGASGTPRRTSSAPR